MASKACHFTAPGPYIPQPQRLVVRSRHHQAGLPIPCHLQMQVVGCVHERSRLGFVQRCTPTSSRWDMTGEQRAGARPIEARALKASARTQTQKTLSCQEAAQI